MPRPLRIEYPGAIYHVMNRGDRREAIYRDDEDCATFLRTPGEACGKTGWQVHAWCLMGNHFHLVLETTQANLVAGSAGCSGIFPSFPGSAWGRPCLRGSASRRGRGGGGVASGTAAFPGGAWERGKQGDGELFTLAAQWETRQRRICAGGGGASW